MTKLLNPNANYTYENIAHYSAKYTHKSTKTWDVKNLITLSTRNHKEFYKEYIALLEIWEHVVLNYQLTGIQLRRIKQETSEEYETLKELISKIYSVIDPRHYKIIADFVYTDNFEIYRKSYDIIHRIEGMLNLFDRAILKTHDET